MRSAEYAVKLEDLLKLRAMQDRLVSVAVLRREWDYAATAAQESERYNAAIIRLMQTGPVPVPDAAQDDEPATG